MNDGPGRRGTLRIYLGAAPGVGKTFAMLNEGRRRRGRGTDVVVGFVEAYGRARTAEQVGDLEVVPRKPVGWRGATSEEMDVDAILTRRPQVALVDELAHTNVPGCRHAKRWEDVEELLAAGIDVVSTVNVQHLESINDVAERITGIKQRETLPDEIVRAAEQVELVDMTPEALRRRMAHGNIFPPEKVDAALANYFRVGNLAALRGARPPVGRRPGGRAPRGIPQTARHHRAMGDAGAGGRGPHRRAVDGGPHPSGGADRSAGARRAARGPRAERRGPGRSAHRPARAAQGAAGRDGRRLPRGDGQRRRHRPDRLRPDPERHPDRPRRQPAVPLAGVQPRLGDQQGRAALRPHRRAHHLGGRAQGGRRRQGPETRAPAGATGTLAHPPPPPGRRLAPGRRRPPSSHRAADQSAEQRQTGDGPAPVPGSGGGHGGRRRTASRPLRGPGRFPRRQLVLLTAPLRAEDRGGRSRRRPAGLRRRRRCGSNFVVAAAQHAADAARARAEAHTLAGLAAATGEENPLPLLVEHLRSALGLDCVALLRADGNGGWNVEAAAGGPVPAGPEDATVAEELAPGTVLALTGAHIAAEELFVLKAFTDQLAAVLERGRLRAEAGRARVLSEANALRSALLQAVSHDLRTPSPPSRRRSRVSARTTSPGPRRRTPSSWPPSTRRPTGSPLWSPTFWT